MDKTLVMLRPHAINMREEVFRDLETGIADNGKMAMSFETRPLSASCINELYYPCRSNYPWWDEFVKGEFVGRRAFVAVYTGNGILPLVRELIGPTNVSVNPFYTIRGKYGRILLEQGMGIVKLTGGKEVCRNIIHSTDETPGEFEREFNILGEFQ